MTKAQKQDAAYKKAYDAAKKNGKSDRDAAIAGMLAEAMC